MYTKEELEKMTVADLRKLAPQVGVKNARQHRKAELVELIYTSQDHRTDNGDDIEDTHHKEAGHDEHEDGRELVADGTADKVRYIEDASVGTLIAFKLPNGKVKTAALVNRSKTKKLIKVVTAYGKEFIVPYDDVLWVRTNGKWPRYVYNMLKGITA